MQLNAFDAILGEPRAPVRQVMARGVGDDSPELSEFKKLIERGRVGFFSRAVKVTPAIARFLLANNPDNRKMKRVLVRSIRDDILAGKWKCNGETIIVSREGLLNDGQNRLSAIVLAKVPVIANMAFGVERESRMTVDTNQSGRSPSDRLTMNGIPNSGYVSRIASVLAMVETGRSWRPNNSSSKESTEVAHRYLTQIETAIENINRQSAKLLGSPGLLGALHVRISMAASDQDQVNEFFRSLLQGDSLHQHSPIFQVRNRLMQSRISRAPLHEDHVAELVIRAWNNRTSVAQVSFVKVLGKIPEILP
ncbi:hypothetical protein [Methylobacterium indicum]|uniref:Uncharacterized protein n=1 Tax=Methylobacterium indicum TaxID=1775910 RepID=A0A8H8X0X9_9HYPH|nr:hypothetical protein [Methylobacterium indicum]BCM87862.1 hypothetical protein mvi_63230 [Methylobacterium indicum]